MRYNKYYTEADFDYVIELVSEYSDSFIIALFHSLSPKQWYYIINNYWIDMNKYAFKNYQKVVKERIKSGEQLTPQLIEDVWVELETEFSNRGCLKLPIEPDSVLKQHIIACFDWVRGISKEANEYEDG